MNVKPLVDIIVPVYEWNKEDRNKFIKMIQESTHVPIGLLIMEFKQSVAQNRNAGLKISTAPYILFMDNDVIVNEGWLEKLIEYIQIVQPLVWTDSTNGGPSGTYDIISPRFVNSNGKINLGLIHRNNLNMPCTENMNEDDNGQQNIIKEVNCLSGTCFMMKRKVFEKVGFFDENYLGSQFEDVDYMYLANQAGFKLLFCGAVKVIHNQHLTNTSSDIFKHNYEYFKSRWLRK